MSIGVDGSRTAIHQAIFGTRLAVVGLERLPSGRARLLPADAGRGLPREVQ